LLKDLKRTVGMSILLITHNLGIVGDLADHVAVMYAGRIVEHASVERLFAEPQHPYTIGLLGSIPRLHLEQARLAAIEGQVPGATDGLEGCRFAPRCPFAVERCRAEVPELDQVRQHQMTACWRAPL